MKATHYILYVTAGIWNLTVCWPLVLIIRLLWGQNLRWERNPDPGKGDGPSLWCDLKPDSWPTRTWYAHYERSGMLGSFLGWVTRKEPRKRPESQKERYGTYYTWGATTLGHGGFYSAGQVDPEEPWSRIQEHEHVHVEQFEASMLRGFLVAVIVAVQLLALGHPWFALGNFLFLWWMGYWWMGIANWSTAAMRGEDAYRGSHHEESAYNQDDHWQQSVAAGEREREKETDA